MPQAPQVKPQSFHAKCLAPNFVPAVLDEIANGGSLIKLCQKIEINYSDAITYLYADPERKKKYEQVLSARAEWYIQRITDELNTIGLVDLKEAFNEDGTLKEISQMPEHITRVISSIEVKEEFEDTLEGKKWIGYTKKVKLNDKLKAIEMLAKHVKFFVEELKVSGKIEHVHSVAQIDLDERVAQLKSRRTPAAVSQEIPVEEAVVVKAGDDI